MLQPQFYFIIDYYFSISSCYNLSVYGCFRLFPQNICMGNAPNFNHFFFSKASSTKSFGYDRKGQTREWRQTIKAWPDTSCDQVVTGNDPRCLLLQTVYQYSSSCRLYLYQNEVHLSSFLFGVYHHPLKQDKHMEIAPSPEQITTISF